MVLFINGVLFTLPLSLQQRRGNDVIRRHSHVPLSQPDHRVPMFHRRLPGLVYRRRCFFCRRDFVLSLMDQRQDGPFGLVGPFDLQRP